MRRTNKSECWKKKYLILLFCIAILVNCISGCSFSGKKSNVTQISNPTQISFSWWGNDERHAYTMDGVDFFQELNSDIDVKYRYGDWNGYEKRFKVYIESHTEADVMQVNYAWLSSYSADGNSFYDLYQLGDYIDLDNFTEQDLSYGEVKGKLNAIPIAFNTTIFYYNQDIYQKYGLELPKTWDDFFRAAEVMRKDGVYPLGLVKKQLIFFLEAYFEQTTGKKMFDEDGTLLLTESDIIYMMDFYKRLLDEKVLMPIDQFDRAKFSAGTVSGSMFWVSDSGNYCDGLEATGGKPVLGEFPLAEGAKRFGYYIKPATMYAISQNTKHVEEAAKLLNYLMNDSNMALQQKTEKGVPISKSAREALSENYLMEGYQYDANKIMIEQRDKMDILLPIMENEELLDIIKNNADKFIYEKITKEKCAENIILEMKELIKD